MSQIHKTVVKNKAKVSREQECICQRVIDGYNVAATAFAGAGKTTTLSRLAELKSGGLVIIMYNRRLAEETRKKIKRAKIATLHSYCQEIYGVDCSSDIGLQQIVNMCDDNHDADHDHTDNKTELSDPSQCTIHNDQYVSHCIIHGDEPCDCKDKMVFGVGININGDDEYDEYGECKKNEENEQNEQNEENKHNNKVICTSKTNFSTLVIDEAQDLTPLMVKVINKLLQNNSQPSNLVLLGDPLQSIYSYQGSTPDFLNNPEKYFAVDPDLWIHASLSTSWRCPPYLCNFVSQVFNIDMISSQSLPPSLPSSEVTIPSQICNGISSGNKGSVKYVVCKPDQVVEYILEYMDRYNIKPSSACLLCSYLRNNYPLIQITNALSTRGNIPLFISLLGQGGSSSSDERLANGKFVVSSIHSMKGRERDCVFIYGFDASYHRIFARDEEQKQGQTDLHKQHMRDAKALFYVALTRAKKHCVVFQDHKEQPLQILPCLDTLIKQKIITINELANTDGTELRPYTPLPKKVKSCSISKAIGNLTSTSSLSLLSKIRLVEVQPCQEPLTIPRIIETSHSSIDNINKDVINDNKDIINDNKDDDVSTYEDISSLISLLLPACLCSWWCHNVVPLLESRGSKLSPTFHDYLKTVKHEGYSSLARFCQIYSCSKLGYLAPLQQISDFSWLRESDIHLALERMSFLSPKNVQWCKQVEFGYLYGTVDLSYSDSIWQLKVQTDISIFDYFETAALLACSNKTTAYLYNVYTNQITMVYFDSDYDKNDFIRELESTVSK